MKKKIAIITFSRAHNYGSILQAYALQRKINQIDECESIIIDFSNSAQKEMYAIFKHDKSIKSFIKNIVAFLGYPLFSREYSDFEAFIDNNLNMTSRQYKTEKELYELNDEYDIFIAGSDQIWNIKCVDADDAYFLGFVKNKRKIAYAPSFGAQDINVCTNNPQKYAKYLNLFEGLSIREKNGQKWIKNLIGKDVSLLIDPTMFFDKEEWYPLMSYPLFKGDYILYYSFHFTQEVNKAVKRISKKLRLPVVILSSHAWIYNFGIMYGFKLAKHAGPAEFLRLVNDAKIVLSNSFHGTVFSTIFEKNFWFIYGSIQDETDDRALTLVQQMGIEDRILKIKDIEKCDFSRYPDYEKVKNKLKKLRTDAFKYLEKHLK